MRLNFMDYKCPHCNENVKLVMIPQKDGSMQFELINNELIIDEKALFKQE